MKLISRITLRISIIVTLILTLWGGLFYFAITDEINDETDDSLEDYSEQLIRKKLSGEDLPSDNNGSNNQFFIRQISPEVARSLPTVSYADSMVYIKEKKETEPARIHSSVFKDDEGAYYVLEVFTPTFEKRDLIQSILVWIILLYSGLVIAIVGVNIWVFYGSMKPFYRLLKWMDSYQIGSNQELPDNQTDITEFKKLNEAAYSYMRRAEQLFEQQKQFIGNASHEIQTPVAICRNRIEMLMEDENLTETQYIELSKTLATLTQISRLNKSLLLLSKIENGQYPEKKKVDFGVMLEKYAEDYQEVFAYKNILFDFSFRGSFKLNMNEALAGMLLSNLLKNAYVHNKEGGEIKVRITPELFSISNTGDPEALDPEKIFKRFYQSKHKKGSSGLGLAIVESICRLENLQLSYSFEKGLHCFKISK
ncbi:MAG: HAMP domain-containing sensor histidine kinase [Bacteroidales bacterium]